MKIRNSFVSNSSSSSFIIAVDPEVKEITAHIKIPFKNICTNKVITTEEEFEKYMLDDGSYDSMEELMRDKWSKVSYEKGIKQLKNGKVLRVGYVTNEGCDPGSLELFLYEEGLKGLNSKDITIVKEIEI